MIGGAYPSTEAPWAVPMCLSSTCTATMAHGGRTTQVWDAPVVHRETGKTIALFRCTQMVLWPRP